MYDLNKAFWFVYEKKMKWAKCSVCVLVFLWRCGFGLWCINLLLMNSNPIFFYISKYWYIFVSNNLIKITWMEFEEHNVIEFLCESFILKKAFLVVLEIQENSGHVLHWKCLHIKFLYVRISYIFYLNTMRILIHTNYNTCFFHIINNIWIESNTHIRFTYT